MNVKRGARGFSTLPGLTKANRRHFLLQLICVGRKEVLTIVGHFTFLVSTTTVEDHHQHAVTRRIIKINLLDETICTALRLRDKKRRLFCCAWGEVALHWSWFSESGIIIMSGLCYTSLYALS